MMFEMQFNSQTECHRINANNKMSVNSSKIPRSFIFTLQLPRFKKCNSQKQYVLMLVTLITDIHSSPTSMWAFLECLPIILQNDKQKVQKVADYVGPLECSSLTRQPLRSTRVRGSQKEDFGSKSAYKVNYSILVLTDRRLTEIFWQ